MSLPTSLRSAEDMPMFRSNRNAGNCLGFAAAMVVSIATSLAGAAHARGDAEAGKELVTKKYVCASCHGAKGAGGGVGPTLKDEKTRKDAAAAAAWIKNPVPPMPKLYPSPLSEKDVTDVTAYVESL